MLLITTPLLTVGGESDKSELSGIAPKTQFPCFDANSFIVFVELVPGQDGLLHISAIPKEKQQDIQQNYKMDSDIMVEVVEYDQQTGRIRLKLANS